MRTPIKNFNDFSKNESTSQSDIYSDIENSTDIEYLTELEKYVDIDIKKFNNTSDAIKKMKAKMRNMSVEDMEKEQLESLTKLKNKIQERIKEIKK